MRACRSLVMLLAAAACGKTSAREEPSKQAAPRAEIAAPPRDAAPLAYRLPAGWHAHDKPGALLLAAKGTDPATLQAFVMSRLDVPLTFETQERCEEIARTMAEPMNGKVRNVRVEARSGEKRGSCEFAIDQGGRTRWDTLVEASAGPPIAIQCEAPSPNENNPDCRAILASIALP